MSLSWRRRSSSFGMIVGQLVGQVGLVAAIPVLTRHYEPGVYGYYQLGSAVAVTIQPLASIRAELVLPSLRHDANAGQLYRRATTVAVALSVCGLLLSVIMLLLGIGGAARSTATAAMLTLSSSVTVLDNARLIRISEYSRLAWRNALSGLFAGIFQVAASLAGLGVIMLGVSVLLGRGLAIALTAGRLSFDPDDRGPEDRRYGLGRMAASISSGVIASFSAQLLTVFSPTAYGPKASAYVGTSQRIAGMPILLIGQGLSQTVQAGSASLIRRRAPGLLRQVRQQLVWCSILGAVVSLGLITLAPVLAVPVLGPGWKEAGTITAILAIPLSMQLVVSPAMPLLPMLGHEKLLLGLQATRLVLGVASIVLSVSVGLDLVGAAIVFGSATVVGYGILLAVVLATVRSYERARRA